MGAAQGGIGLEQCRAVPWGRFVRFVMLVAVVRVDVLVAVPVAEGGLALRRRYVHMPYHLQVVVERHKLANTARPASQRNPSSATAVNR